MRQIEEVKTEIRELQNEMAIAIENGNMTEAYDMEKKIDELQKELFGLKSCQ
jgi:hypothetical protein